MKIIEVNIDYKVIGERIKLARKRKGMTQEQGSELLNIAPAYLSRIERGSSKVSLRRLMQISKAFDIPIAELITGSSPENEQYLDKELYEVLKKCTPEKQRLIYNIAKTISGLKIK